MPPKGINKVHYYTLHIIVCVCVCVCVLVNKTRKEGRAAQFLKSREVKEAERRTSFSKVKWKQAITVKVS